MTFEKYEFHLCFWGEIANENWVERDLGVRGHDFWFGSKQERKAFKKKLAEVAKTHGVVIVFSENEGISVRKRTIARMKFTLPNGRAYPYEYDFGYGYPPDAAEFMFSEGSFSCDCAKSSFLSREHPEVLEMGCGNSIVLSDFVVTQE